MAMRHGSTKLIVYSTRHFCATLSVRAVPFGVIGSALPVIFYPISTVAMAAEPVSLPLTKSLVE